ncbi:FAD-binding oxidoreductase [Denitromonas sp.]|uniref:FAD-binding oxidoreductase n=1 Tax=Denitromonas sp. TaxID=2734609 RepID=UPI002AFF8C11|nr:FAD-binding oxidoreductase [Denitromonas sp.]
MDERRITRHWGRLVVRLTVAVVVANGAAYAQTADEHAAHHPASAASQLPDTLSSDTIPANGGPSGGMSKGGMSEGGMSMGGMSMGGMSMGGMSMGGMKPGCQGDACGQDSRITTQLYPQLMALPDLPPERRAGVEHVAHQRMSEGIRELASLSQEVSAAVARSDYATLQEASERMRVAWGNFDSGLSAYRALTEGQAPRGVALNWFRQQMNLTDPLSTVPVNGARGLSGFHYATMGLLLAFALLAGWLYVARTRRTNAILTALRTGTTPAPDAGATSMTATPPAGPDSGAVLAHPPAPTTGSWAGALRVARVFQETPDVKTFRFAPVEGIGALQFTFEPGQFLTVSAPAGEKRVKRSYSISSSPCCHGWCELTIKHAQGGVVSGHFHEQVKQGDIIDVSGPYGHFTFRGIEADSVVFLGGGVGITPLMSAIRYLTDQSWNGRIDLVYACRDLDNVIFREELSQLAARHPNLHVTIVLSHEKSEAWNGARGYINAELLGKVPDIRSRRIHLCGPLVMMDAVRTELGKLGIDPASVHSELFLAPPKPATPASAAAPQDAATAVECCFSRSAKTLPLAADQTVLEVAEAAGIPVESACRQGFCGICKVKLLSGQVTMEVSDGLTALDKSSGMILACQAKASVDISVDA